MVSSECRNLAFYIIDMYLTISSSPKHFLLEGGLGGLKTQEADKTHKAQKVKKICKTHKGLQALIVEKPAVKRKCLFSPKEQVHEYNRETQDPLGLLRFTNKNTSRTDSNGNLWVMPGSFMST